MIKRTRKQPAPKPLDLQELMTNSLAKISQSDFIANEIEKNLRSTVKDIIENFFRSYGEFSKSLKQEVQDKLRVNLTALDIPSYNVLITNLMKETFDQEIVETGVAKIKEVLQEILSESQKEYKLSEIVELIKQDELSDDEDLYGSGKEMTLIVDREFSLSTYIHIDADEDERKYGCKYAFVVEAETGILRSIKIDDVDFSNKDIVGGMYGLRKKLFQMFASGAKIIINENEADLYYPEYRDE